MSDGQECKYCDTLAEPHESSECPQCDRAKDARYRAEIDRYDAIADLERCIDTMGSVTFVNRGDALRVESLLNRLVEKYGL